MDSRPTTVARSPLLTALFGLALVVGTGCRMTAPPQKIESAVHAPDDIAGSQQQIRLRVRALVEPLSGAVIESADRISAGTTNRAIRREALVWKMEAVPALRETLFRPNPFEAIMDAWVLTWQMSDYFESGRGKEMFEDAAPLALATCQRLENQMETVAASITISGNVSDARTFARNWAKTHPIGHAIGARESTLSRVNERELQEAFSMPELAVNVLVTLDDLSRRLDVYSVQLPEQSRWQAELFALDLAANYQWEKAMPLAEAAVESATGAVKMLKQLEHPLQAALAVAGTAPELVRQERRAALEHLTKEREAALTEVRQTATAEREALTADIERISATTVDRAAGRAARLIGVTVAVVFAGIIFLLFIARQLFVKTPKEKP